MRRENWLESYATIKGMELTLARVSRRFQRETNLVPAIDDLQGNYETLRNDFDEFFPQIEKKLNIR